MKRFRVLIALLVAAAPLAPRHADADPVRFAVIGDFGSGAKRFHVNELIAGWGVDFVITVGDNAYSKDTSDAGHPQNAFEVDVVASFRMFIEEGNFFPSLGNHDYRAQGGGIVPERVQRYLDTLKPPRDGQGEGRYYEFARGPVHFFALNSNGKHEPDGGIRFWDKQGDWLREQLAAAREPFKVVYFHHTPYTTGTEDGPTGSMRWPFKEWGASLVLAGHEHNYERFDRRGLTYVVNGIGGAGFYRLKMNAQVPGLTRAASYPTDNILTAQQVHGAMLIEASDTEMKARAITVGGVRYSDEHLSSHPQASVIVVNDISLPHGQNTVDHNGHETGLMSDLRLPRKDGGSGGTTWQDTSEYDQASTRAMLEAFRNSFGGQGGLSADELTAWQDRTRRKASYCGLSDEGRFVPSFV